MSRTPGHTEGKVELEGRREPRREQEDALDDGQLEPVAGGFGQGAAWGYRAYNSLVDEALRK